MRHYRCIALFYLGRQVNSKIWSNILWLIADFVLKYVVGFIAGILVAKHLGVDYFGIYNYCLAIIAIVSFVGNLGLKDILIQELVEKRSNSERLLGSAFFLLLSSNLIIFILFNIVIQLVYQSDDIAKIIISIISFSFLFKGFNVIHYFFESRIQSKYYVWSNQLSSQLFVILKFVIVFFSLEIFYLAYASLLQTIIFSLLLLAIFSHKGFGVFRWKLDIKLSLHLLRRSLPFMFSGILILIYIKIDQIMVRELVSDYEAGIYAVSVKFTELFYVLPTFVYASVYPKLMEIKSEKVFNQNLSKFYMSSLIYSILVSLSIAIFSYPIITWTYGMEYIMSAKLLSASIWVLIFVSLGIVRNAYIYKYGLEREYVIITLISALLNIALNFILIPKLFSFGAIIATLVSYSFSGYFSSFLFKKLRGQGIVQTQSIFFLNYNLLLQDVKKFIGSSKRN